MRAHAHGARPGRPRDAEAERAILEATLELIARQGYAGLRTADVALRAGVSKATMYRRWPSKTQLVVAALRTTPDLRAPDSGSLRGDLEALQLQLLQVAERAPLAGLLPALAAERAHDPELAEALDALVRERMRPFVEALQRAVARREIPPEVDLEHAVALVNGPFLMRLFFGPPPDARSVRALVDLAVRALERA